MAATPWASGPSEILQHGLSLLQKDSDVNRRLAMITIDNAVELLIKIYLGLPSRVTGIKLSRDKYREISESFPKLLDAFEEHAPDKMTGIDLGEIEWYHRLRNELYHQGNGLTVERTHVEVYAELAKLLFKNLFGSEIKLKEDAGMELLGTFMNLWSRIESLAYIIASNRFPDVDFQKMLPMGPFRELHRINLVDRATTEELDRLRKIRNELAHGGTRDYRTVITDEAVTKLQAIADKFEIIQEDEKRSRGETI